jgi:Bacterial CdiA-CT RNAse A domain
MLSRLLSDRRVIAVLVLLVLITVQAVSQRFNASANSPQSPTAQVPHTTGETGEDEDEGSLAREERQGGHLIRKHVGQTPDQLRARLDRERHISAASSFQDLPTAEAAVTAALNSNRDRISQWLAGSSPRFVVNYTAPNTVGLTLRRGDRDAEPTRRLRLVLVRDDGERDGYRILTGYPTP